MAFLSFAACPVCHLERIRFIGFSIQVDDDVSQDAIKTAYRQAAKFCHPDVHDAGHELCILLNEVYHVHDYLQITTVMSDSTQHVFAGIFHTEQSSIKVEVQCTIRAGPAGPRG